MSFFLGIDLGTSYFKAGVFDENGELQGLGRCTVKKNTDGIRCELEISVFWNTLRDAVNEALENAQILPKMITALSYSSQANSFVLLDAEDKPLTDLILWTDKRAAEIPDKLTELTGREDFLTITGLGIKPGNQSMIAKIDWLRHQQPEIWERTRSIMSISDYLTFSLTEQKISDLSTASMTGLLDIKKGGWWKTATDLFGIHESHLPTPERSGTFAGNLTGKGAKLLGLSRQTLFYLGGLDHHMAAVGAGLTRFDYIVESTGTVLACTGYREGYAPKNGINMAPGLDENHFFQMAFDTNGAVALEWYQTNHAPELSIIELLDRAEKIEAGCGGLIAKPSANEYEGLSGFINTKDSYTHAYFVRAILESTSLSLSRLVNGLEEAKKIKAVIPSGGGAQSRLWLQIKANMLGKTFLLPDSGELACKGAAMLCALGMSDTKKTNETVEKQIRIVEEIYPETAGVEKYKEWMK